MSTIPSQGNPSRKVTIFDERLLHEVDREFLQKDGQTGSGRELFGESFTSVLSQNFPFSMPGITGDDGKVTLRFVAYTGVTGEGTITLSIDGQQLLNGIIPHDKETYTKAREFAKTAAWQGTKNENPKVTVTYNKPSAPSFLDYIRLQARRTLQPYGAYTSRAGLSAHPDRCWRSWCRRNCTGCGIPRGTRNARRPGRPFGTARRSVPAQIGRAHV